MPLISRPRCARALEYLEKEFSISRAQVLFLVVRAVVHWYIMLRSTSRSVCSLSLPLHFRIYFASVLAVSSLQLISRLGFHVVIPCSALVLSRVSYDIFLAQPLARVLWWCVASFRRIHSTGSHISEPESSLNLSRLPRHQASHPSTADMIPEESKLGSRQTERADARNGGTHRSNYVRKRVDHTLLEKVRDGLFMSRAPPHCTAARCWI